MPTVGVDIGQSRDPTAIAVVDGLDVIHLEKLPLLTPYPVVAGRIASVAAAAGHCTIVLDATGVGRGVADDLEARGLAPICVTLGGGQRVHVQGRRVSLPRRALFLPIEGAIGAGRLRVAEGCPFRGELAAELLAMRATARGAESRGAQHHGDLCVSVALALYGQALARLLPA